MIQIEWITLDLELSRSHVPGYKNAYSRLVIVLRRPIVFWIDCVLYFYTPLGNQKKDFRPLHDSSTTSTESTNFFFYFKML